MRVITCLDCDKKIITNTLEIHECDFCGNIFCHGCLKEYTNITSYNKLKICRQCATERKDIIQEIERVEGKLSRYIATYEDIFNQLCSTIVYKIDIEVTE